MSSYERARRWRDARDAAAPKPHPPLQHPRMRRYEPGLRYRRWELVDNFKMMLPTWQMLRRGLTNMNITPNGAIAQAFVIERDCSELSTTYREFELMVKARLRIEFGLAK